MKLPKLKAPSLFVSILFAIAGIVGYWMIGADATGAALTEAMALVMALWKFLQVWKEPAGVEAQSNRSKFNRMWRG